MYGPRHLRTSLRCTVQDVRPSLRCSFSPRLHYLVTLGSISGRIEALFWVRFRPYLRVFLTLFRVYFESIVYVFCGWYVGPCLRYLKITLPRPSLVMVVISQALFRADLLYFGNSCVLFREQSGQKGPGGIAA